MNMQNETDVLAQLFAQFDPADTTSLGWLTRDESAERAKLEQLKSDALYPPVAASDDAATSATMVLPTTAEIEPDFVSETNVVPITEARRRKFVPWIAGGLAAAAVVAGATVIVPMVQNSSGPTPPPRPSHQRKRPRQV